MAADIDNLQPEEKLTLVFIISTIVGKENCNKILYQPAALLIGEAATKKQALKMSAPSDESQIKREFNISGYKAVSDEVNGPYYEIIANAFDHIVSQMPSVLKAKAHSTAKSQDTIAVEELHVAFSSYCAQETSEPLLQSGNLGAIIRWIDQGDNNGYDEKSLQLQKALKKKNPKLSEKLQEWQCAENHKEIYKKIGNEAAETEMAEYYTKIKNGLYSIDANDIAQLTEVAKTVVDDLGKNSSTLNASLNLDPSQKEMKKEPLIKDAKKSL